MPIRYHVAVDGALREVSIEQKPGASPTVHVDGAPMDADVVFVPGGVSLRVDGVVYDVQVGGTADALTVSAGGDRAFVSVQRERGVGQKPTVQREGEVDVRAPMPGRVIDVLVAVGDVVAADQPLVVIEAMKMQNELRAAGSGTVVAVEVAVGRNVERNALLVRLDVKA